MASMTIAARPTT